MPMLPIISASRRTDLIRCYPEKLAEWINNRRVTVKNPYNQKEKKISLDPLDVHTMVLWSKDYSVLLNDVYQLKTKLKQYSQLYLHFTVTGMGGSSLEPEVIAPEKAMEQFEPLVKITGDPRRVLWRFDPILFWHDRGKLKSNLDTFEMLAEAAKKAGLTNVMASLCHWYKKSIRRATYYNVEWFQEKKSDVGRISRWLKKRGDHYGLQVLACCRPDMVAAGLESGSCINGQLLTMLHPKRTIASNKRDSGQRKDCGCTQSIDIGSYDLACPHGCVYCYANAR